VEWMRLMDLTKAVQQKKLKIQDQLKKRGDWTNVCDLRV
jgi:hypothetical protein